MDPNRRKFIRYSLCVIGSTTAAAVSQKASRGWVAATAAATASAQPSTSPSPAPKATAEPATHPQAALTTDHQLVRLPDGGAIVPEVPIATARLGIADRKWIMVIDLAKCDGCGHCIDACQKMHFTRPNQPWIKVLRMKDSQYAAPYYFPQPCFHCDNPPCTKVCPVDATYKRSDGLVLVDNERCIGCRFCIAGCPYSVRVFNWGHPQDPPRANDEPYSPEHGIPRRIGTVEKCDFCPDMARVGKLPGCVSGCPMGAIYFGDQNEDAVTNGLDETVRLTALLSSNAGYRHLEELGTEPRVYYLPAKNRMYPAPGKTGEST